jgi:hypothetical protein
MRACESRCHPRHRRPVASNPALKRTGHSARFCASAAVGGAVARRLPPALAGRPPASRSPPVLSGPPRRWGWGGRSRGGGAAWGRGGVLHGWGPWADRRGGRQRGVGGGSRRGWGARRWGRVAGMAGALVVRQTEGGGGAHHHAGDSAPRASGRAGAGREVHGRRALPPHAAANMAPERTAHSARLLGVRLWRAGGPPLSLGVRLCVIVSQSEPAECIPSRCALPCMWSICV